MLKPIETLRVIFAPNNSTELREGDRLWTFENCTKKVQESFEILAEGKAFMKLPSAKLQGFLLEEHLIYIVQEFVVDSNHRTLHWLSYKNKNAYSTLNELRKKTVAILGCGGTGGIIAEHLVRAGVTSLILVDGGVVDEPDLNRQLHFTRRTLGHCKVGALAAHLLEIKPELNLRTHHTYISSEENVLQLLENVSLDLIVCAVDQPIYKIQAMVGEGALRMNVPVLFGAVGISDAVIGPLFTDFSELKKQNQNFRSLAQNATAPSEIVKGSLCFINTMAAAQMALEAFKFLSNYGGDVAIKNKAQIISYNV